MGSPRSNRLEQMWDGRTTTWHSHVTSSTAFEAVRAAVVEAARPRPNDRVVDLGAGTGFLTFEFAALTAAVMAVDVSVEMLAAIELEATQRQMPHITTRRADLSTFDLPAESVDLVITSYALHHLVDDDKQALVLRSIGWLRPEGRLVIADMMFGRGGTPEDRRIIRAKVTRLLRRGPAGAWRVARNVLRFGLRTGTELPASRSFWISALREAGFVEVSGRPIVEEAGLVSGRRPAIMRPQPINR